MDVELPKNKKRVYEEEEQKRAYKRTENQNERAIEGEQDTFSNKYEKNKPERSFHLSRNTHNNTSSSHSSSTDDSSSEDNQKSSEEHEKRKPPSKSPLTVEEMSKILHFFIIIPLLYKLIISIIVFIIFIYKLSFENELITFYL